MENCCICGEGFEDGKPSSILTQKGCDNIMRVSSSQGNTINVQAGNRVHQKCRLDLVRPRKPKPSTVESEATVSRRSTKPKFNSKDQCIFCGQSAKYDGRKKGFDVIPVRTKDFQDSIAKLCKERSDEWSQIVLGRLEHAQDLHAADTVYHQMCSVNFRTGKQVPKQHCSDLSSSDKDAKRLKQG